MPRLIYRQLRKHFRAIDLHFKIREDISMLHFWKEIKACEEYYILPGAVRRELEEVFRAFVPAFTWEWWEEFCREIKAKRIRRILAKEYLKRNGIAPFDLAKMRATSRLIKIQEERKNEKIQGSGLAESPGTHRG